MPVIIRNSSPERWVRFPVPFEARLILPGLALAWAMNSGTVLAGNDGLTSKTKESLLMLATGSMSRVTVTVLFLIERHVDDVRGGDKKKRVAVGRSARDRLECEIAAGARPVVDDHRLAEPLRQRLADQAPNDVGRAAGRNEDDQGHRPHWVGLGPRHSRDRRQHGSAGRQMEKSSAGEFHSITSSALASSGRKGSARQLSARLKLHVGCADYLAPLVGIFGEELSKLGRRKRKRGAAQLAKPRLKLGIGEACIDL